MRWSSVKVGDITPSQWYGWVGPGVLLLKDTRKGAFSNRLDDRRTFLYELPQARRLHDATLQRLHDEANAASKTVEVRLFSVECARNFYLGEWVVSSIELHDKRTYVRLLRLRAQDATLQASYEVVHRPKRSRSEDKHATMIEELLPGWKVSHEPECVAFHDNELVVSGEMREWGGDAYVCDYVACQGSRRVCFESKSSTDGFTEEAKLKCRALRDRSCTRVVTLIDHGEWLTWYDFGCPVHAIETSGSDIGALRDLLIA